MLLFQTIKLQLKLAQVIDKCLSFFKYVQFMMYLPRRFGLQVAYAQQNLKIINIHNLKHKS